MYWFEEYDPETNEILYGIQFGSNKGYKPLLNKPKKSLFKTIIFYLR